VSRGMYYDVEGNELPNAEAWIPFLGDNQWRIQNEVVQVNGGETVMVSTVHLGMNHNFMNDGPPLIFETMIFGGKHDQYQERYATKEQAEEGHREALRLVNSEANDE